MIVSGLPRLNPLLSDNPNDLIFDAFLTDAPLQSLSPVNLDRRSLLLKALALANAESPLLPQEKQLISLFISGKRFNLLRTFLLQKLRCGYLHNFSLYEETVSYILSEKHDLDTISNIIKCLPLITKDVWTYIRSLGD